MGGHALLLARLVGSFRHKIECLNTIYTSFLQNQLVPILCTVDQTRVRRRFGQIDDVEKVYTPKREGIIQVTLSRE